MTSEDDALDRFRSFLYCLVRAHSGNGELNHVDASDIVQQTLMDAYTRRQQFRGTTDAERAAWLRRILICNLIDALRHQSRKKRAGRASATLETEVEGSIHRAEDWLAAFQSTPSQRAQRNEELYRLADALTQLPSAQREAVVLRHLQGQSLAEIAATLQRTEPAVAGLVYRGLQHLRRLLDDGTER